MSAHEIKGWCPNAWRPMMAGDGLLVRVKPKLAQLTRAQALGLCDAALAHGNGLIDVTRRANLQIRGVRENNWPALIERLEMLALVDADPISEKRRNIVVAPDWQTGDANHRIASELLGRLGELPDLPDKAGFLIDAGPMRMLSNEPGDFRIERGEHDKLILHAEGRNCGVAVAPGKEVDALIAFANWFVSSGGIVAGRMVRHQAELPDFLAGTCLPAGSAVHITPGQHRLGAAYGVPFGQIAAEELAGAIDTSLADAIRITPWRILLFENAIIAPIAGLISSPEDPLLRTEACPGAPHCPQSTVETRTLAERLAPHVRGRLHVSGCDKRCACSHAVDITLTGRGGLFDLSLSNQSGSEHPLTDLTSAEVLAHFGAH